MPPDLLSEIDLGGIRRSTIRRHQPAVDEEVRADDGIAGRDPGLDDDSLDADQVRFARLGQGDGKTAVVAASLRRARTDGRPRARGGLGSPEEGTEPEQEGHEGDETRDQDEATSVEDHVVTPDVPPSGGREKIEACRDGVK